MGGFDLVTGIYKDHNYQWHGHNRSLKLEKISGFPCMWGYVLSRERLLLEWSHLYKDLHLHKLYECNSTQISYKDEPFANLSPQGVSFWSPLPAPSSLATAAALLLGSVSCWYVKHTQVVLQSSVPQWHTRALLAWLTSEQRAGGITEQLKSLWRDHCTIPVPCKVLGESLILITECLSVSNWLKQQSREGCSYLGFIPWNKLACSNMYLTGTQSYKAPTDKNNSHANLLIF